jgi:hypothetical protein
LIHLIDLRLRRMQVIGVNALKTIQQSALRVFVDNNMYLQAILNRVASLS